MTGPILRMIKSQGREYTVRNATRNGGREIPDYSDDGTVVAALEQRSQSMTTTQDSSGEEVDADLQLRAIVDDELELHETGEADWYPTLLVHPNGQTYEVVGRHPEDSGVTVLTVVRG